MGSYRAINLSKNHRVQLRSKFKTKNPIESPSSVATMLFPLLKGKTAIVTGGTTGIGRGIVLEYLRQGCNVVVNHLGLARDDGHRSSLLQEAKQIALEGKDGNGQTLAGEIQEVQGDISKPEDCSLLVEETVKWFGKVDIMVANAGIFKPAKFLE